MVCKELYARTHCFKQRVLGLQKEAEGSSGAQKVPRFENEKGL